MSPQNKTNKKALIINAEHFSYYADGFHDGSIYKIKQTERTLCMEMETTQMYICDNKDDIPLSERDTLYGILHANGVHSIKNYGKDVSSLEVKYDDGYILDFELKDTYMCIAGFWVGYGANKPPEGEEKYFEIEVVATTIYWENTADMKDTALLGKYMGLPGKPPYGYPQWYIDKYGPQED